MRILEPVNIDVIILSFARDEKLKKLTVQTITTLLASEDPGKIHFNIVIVESNKNVQPFQYENTTTIYPAEKFGFHRYFNIGIGLTNNPYVCLANNDLIFHKNWASEILKVMGNDAQLLSAHPCLPGYEHDHNFTGEDSQRKDYFGGLFGWCIFVKRDIFDIIGPLDENFTFWYSDYDYYETLKKHGVKNALIPSSQVTHLGWSSWGTMNNKEHHRLTQLTRLYYSYKWKHHSFSRYALQLLLYKFKLLFVKPGKAFDDK